MAQGLHDDDVLARKVFVERNVAGIPAGDHELVKTVLGGPSDQWMARKNLHPIPDCAHGGRRAPRVLGRQKFEYALKISLGTRRVLYFRHRFSLGRRAGLPSARAAK